jgi:hypothetical protein
MMMTMAARAASTEFAVANQFYLISKSAGLDYRRIAHAMKHNFPRARACSSRPGREFNRRATALPRPRETISPSAHSLQP